MRETRERQERDGAMADGLTYTNKIATEMGLEESKERDEAMADGLT